MEEEKKAPSPKDIILGEAKEARKWLNTDGGQFFLRTLRRAFKVDEIFDKDPFRMAYKAAQVDFLHYIEQLAIEGGFRNG
jgi:hypothetical protein